MKLNEIIELFCKGLEDVLASLGIGGNKYQIQEMRSISTEDMKTIINEQSVVLWGKVEKNQGMVVLCLSSEDVRSLVGSLEGTIPEEINESVINTLKELGDTFLGGGLSALAQSAKKGVVQFENTGILKGEEVLKVDFTSPFQEPILCSFVKIDGGIQCIAPWILLLDSGIKKWFTIEEDRGETQKKETMLTQDEIESFLNSQLTTMETPKAEPQSKGAKQVSTQEAGSNYRNLDVILDIQVEATARLGSVEMPLATVLSLGPGSVINVGHEVDSPIELYVNNKLIAKGDVVIVDEKFGIRITEIVSPKERIESLQ